MLRNYLAAALRNLVRNRLHAAINIVGLAVGFAAALLIALYVRDEFSYDRWIPGHERTYAVLMRASGAAGAPMSQWNTAVIDMAPLLKLDFPQIEEATRIRINAGAAVRHGDTDFLETIWWADAKVFHVFPLPAIAGDLATALEQPDGLVLTRRMARKYFGRDNPVGETIELNHNTTFRVTAVLEDLPSNTTFAPEIIASGRAAISPITTMETNPARGPLRPINVRAVYTYIRLKPGTSIASLQADADAFATRRLQDEGAGGVIRRQEPVFVPLADLHLTPFGDNPMTPPGSASRIRALVTVGFIIVGLAVINFVNLMSARGSRRAVEVGVRKVSGAQRLHLVIQFMGEAVLYAAFCMMLATVIAALLRPGLNGFLQRHIALAPSPSAIAFLAAAAGVMGLLAGFYPAIVLSSFRPAAVLKGIFGQGTRFSAGLRTAFVVVQFSILIGLIVVAGVIFRQTRFAQNEGLRLAKDEIIHIQTACRTAFKDEVAKLPGIRAVACSNLAPVNNQGFALVHSNNGAETMFAQNSVDFGFFELYGLEPLAGRFFSRDRGRDQVIAGRDNEQPTVVVNQTAARILGFSIAASAVGQTVSFRRFNYNNNGQATDLAPAEIIGVVPDFPIGPITAQIQPTIFYIDSSAFAMLQVRLSGKDIPETLDAIKKLWAKYTNNFPFSFTFFDQRIQAFYADVIREGQLFDILAAIAVFIACLGLYGLSAFTAESRTKEIGIRKAMGATRRDILGLVLWQFTKPVLWANVIAWPAAYLIMRRWLEGFAYHIDLAPWMFLAASALALIIAIATVIGHALLVARAKPVTALRYE